jgi:hypothetical protein
MTFARSTPAPLDDDAPLLARDVRFNAAVDAMITERTLNAAATKAGISARTLRRWLSNPAFAAAVREARRHALAATSTALVAATTTATDALVTIAEDKEAPHAARVQAARALLDHARGFVEVDDFAAELADMKKTMTERANASAMNNAAPPQKAE